MTVFQQSELNNAVLNIDRCTAKTTGGSAGHGFRFSDSGGAGTYQINWGSGNRILGTFLQPFITTGSAYKMVQKKIQVNLDKTAITSGTTNIPLLSTAKESAYVSYATFKSPAAIALDATNYVNRLLRSNINAVVATVQTTTDSAAIAAATASDLITGTTYAANKLLGDDDILYLTATAVGTGRTWDGAQITVHYLDFETV